MVLTTPVFRVLLLSLPSSPQSKFFSELHFGINLFKGQMNTDNVLMHNTDMEREGGDSGGKTEMDLTDKTVFGQQMGKTVAWVVECRRRDSKSGKGGEGQRG